MAQFKQFYRGTVGQILMPEGVEIPTRPARGRGQRIQGVNGFLKWHYYTAAEVKSYTVTRDPQGTWSLSCFVVSPDAYKIAQKPLRFVAPHETGEWRWMVESIEIRDGRVSAVLGPMLP